MQQNITLLENDTFITDNSVVTNIFKKFFSNSEDILIDTNAIDEPIKRAILKYSFHPSVLKIKDMVNIKERFSFTIVSQDDIATIIKNLDTSKASYDNIPSKILKQNIDIYLPLLTKMFNDSVLTQSYHQKLKLDDIAPVHKENELTDKGNYQ